MPAPATTMCFPARRGDCFSMLTGAVDQILSARCALKQYGQKRGVALKETEVFWDGAVPTCFGVVCEKEEGSEPGCIAACLGAALYMKDSRPHLVGGPCVAPPEIMMQAYRQDASVWPQDGGSMCPMLPLRPAAAQRCLSPTAEPMKSWRGWNRRTARSRGAVHS